MIDEFQKLSVITYSLMLTMFISAVFFQFKDVHIYIVGMLLSSRIDKLIPKDTNNE